MLQVRVALASVAMLFCAACSDEGTSAPTPSDPATPTSSSPTPSIPPELVGYDEAERAAYTRAVAAYADYLDQSDRIYAKGKTTVAAKDFLQRYSIDWSTAWGDLAVVANNGVRITGTTRVVWTTPKAIDLGTKAGDVVVIRRCVDESDRVVTQGGKRLEQPHFKFPHIYQVRLEKRPAESWWRAGEPKLEKTC